MKAVIGSLIVSLCLGACRSNEAPSPAPTPDSTPDSAPAPTPSPTPDSAPSPAPDSAPTAADPQWWRDSVAYEIFVRSFQDSDGDGIGDFRGILSRLDHLERLGVDLVWLMPIHPSPSYHGYDVTDYLAVNPQYGSMADFEALLAEGKKRGIRFIMDWVLNHSSDKHPWFIESRKGPTLPSEVPGQAGAPNDKYGWYTWRESKPDASEGWARPWDGAELWHELPHAAVSDISSARSGPLRHGPAARHAAVSSWYYGLFWGGMPDLNIANPAVQKVMEDGMRFWLDKGLAGFRVDAIRYLIETVEDGQGLEADTAATHAYLKAVRKSFAASHPEALMVGEIWSSADDQAGYYGDGEMLHQAFSFDMASALIETTRDGVRSRLNQMIDRSAGLFGKDRGFEAPFLTNHDMQRVARLLQEDAQKLRVAAALMLASPGTPYVYYGEELGMIGGAEKADENKRTPMRWTADAATHYGFTTGTPWWPMTDEKDGIDVATELADPRSLMNHYAALIKARKASFAMRRGDQTRLDVAVVDGSAPKGLVVFQRTATSSDGARTARAVVIANVDSAAIGAFSVAGTGTARVLIAEGLDSPPRVEDGRLIFSGLGPQSFAWVALE